MQGKCREHRVSGGVGIVGMGSVREERKHIREGGEGAKLMCFGDVKKGEKDKAEMIEKKW